MAKIIFFSHKLIGKSLCLSKASAIWSDVFCTPFRSKQDSKTHSVLWDTHSSVNFLLGHEEKDWTALILLAQIRVMNINAKLIARTSRQFNVWGKNVCVMGGKVKCLITWLWQQGYWWKANRILHLTPGLHLFPCWKKLKNKQQEPEN